MYFRPENKTAETAFGAKYYIYNITMILMEIQAFLLNILKFSLNDAMIQI